MSDISLNYNSFAGKRYIAKWNQLISQWNSGITHTKHDIEINVLELHFWFNKMMQDRAQITSHYTDEMKCVNLFMSSLSA